MSQTVKQISVYLSVFGGERKEEKGHGISLCSTDWLQAPHSASASLVTGPSGHTTVYWIVLWIYLSRHLPVSPRLALSL